MLRSCSIFYRLRYFCRLLLLLNKNVPVGFNKFLTTPLPSLQKNWKQNYLFVRICFLIWCSKSFLFHRRWSRSRTFKPKPAKKSRLRNTVRDQPCQTLTQLLQTTDEFFLSLFLLADFPERQQQLLLGDGRLTVALISSWLELERRLKAALLVGGGTTISCAVQLARWSAAVSKVKTITNSQNSQSVFCVGRIRSKNPEPCHHQRSESYRYHYAVAASETWIVPIEFVSPLGLLLFWKNLDQLLVEFLELIPRYRELLVTVQLSYFLSPRCRLFLSLF